MDAIITQVQSLASNANEAGRKEVIGTLRNLQYAVETPNDTLNRFAGLNLQIAGARIGVDLGIFSALHESKQPLSVEALARKNGAAPELLDSPRLTSEGRNLRYLASVGQIKETSKDHFSSSSITATLADDNYQGGIHHFFDTVGPSIQELPDFLAATNYQNITESTKTPFNRAFDTELPAFVWFPSQPERFAHFQKVMTVQRAGAPIFISTFQFKKELGNFQGKPVFVDVGGGFGNQAMAVLEAFPELSGKLILQDLPQTLEHVPAIDGIQVMAHNFFEPQVVKVMIYLKELRCRTNIISGAKFYYLRNILHDWPDEKSVVILKNIISAMEPDSRILIDDKVLPNEKVHWQATQEDLTMMATLGSKERTVEQLRVLMDSAGLEVLDIVQYTTSLNDSIIVAVPK
ncbi:hypothetical protein HYALB_00003635 [Hymenoscyphus albidus]|uniref:O-methyltransferase C-terminal domain-containing protein n=1 Tax=Hymenoscyphus albidus TaxID=595503 RepID=A0A9N9QBK4_9HELO|nr:hypothetical protein HYALB_00003635 [Hymenoscyphus albidus]